MSWSGGLSLHEHESVSKAMGLHASEWEHTKNTEYFAFQMVLAEFYRCCTSGNKKTLQSTDTREDKDLELAIGWLAWTIEASM